MTSLLHFLVNALFVFSVVFIWLMLLYQFVLCIGGFLWHQQAGRGQKTSVGNDCLPRVSILIPAHNEEKVIELAVTRMCELHYPKDKLEILVINDGSSDRTGEILTRLMAADARVRVLDVPRERGGRGKSAALNLALAQARFEALAVYDADNIPEKDSLLLLARALLSDRRLAAVTGKFRAYNKSRSLLTRLVNLESIAFQWIVQAGRWFFLRISALPGTNFIIWKRVVEECGGWDEAALTEDTELTFRLYERGFRIQFLPTATTWEQEPENLSDWMRQRTRWARGNNYIIAKYGRTVFKKKPTAGLLELLNLFYLYYFFIFAILVSDVLFLLSLIGVAHIRLAGPYAELWGLAFLLFLLELLVALSFEKEDNLLNLGVGLLAYVTYTKLWVLVVLRALYLDYVKKSSRSWSKTERYETGKPTGPSV